MEATLLCFLLNKLHLTYVYAVCLGPFSDNHQACQYKNHLKEDTKICCVFSYYHVAHMLGAIKINLDCVRRSEGSLQVGMCASNCEFTQQFLLPLCPFHTLDLPKHSCSYTSHLFQN